MALSFRDIRKSFGAVTALDGVSFDVAEGAAHAIVGENGAGKSTLLKILAGLVRPDTGTIHWNDQRLDLHSPHDAIGRGIGMVYQEMLSFPNLTVSANIFAGRELCSFGRLRDREMHARTRELLDQLHLPVDPEALAESLSAAHRQLLQVARALAFKCRILILDEPTTALTDAEADHLFGVLRRLRQEGTTLLYVSHRLPEVFRLCERITVLRDGRLATTVDRDAVQPDEIVRAMVGRDLPARSARVSARSDDASPALELERLSRPPCFHDVSLVGRPRRNRRTVRPGRVGPLRAARDHLRPAPADGRRDGHRRRGPAAAIRQRRRRAPASRSCPRSVTVRASSSISTSAHNLVQPRHTINGDVLIRRGEERRDAEALRREMANQGAER